MNHVEKIISAFGGQSSLAKALDKRQSTISYWAKSGKIPAKNRAEILKAAAENNISISESDLGGSVNVLDEGEVVLKKATHWGELTLGDTTIPCYVLEDGERVFSLKGVMVALMKSEGGAIGEFLKVKSLKPFLPIDLVPNDTGGIPALFSFDTGGTAFAKEAIGVSVERFMDICIAYSNALADFNSKSPGVTLTERQLEIAIKANEFLRASAKTGIIALVDEATGYQYDRAPDALQVKLKLFLAEEMRKWEKTFPDELWVQFGRLTKWQGSLHSRPKYWGKLVNEMVYGYLDADVYKWLKSNAPKPVGNLSYHRWLNDQYGLKKLMEHIWQLVGMASACNSMDELRRRMAEKYGHVPTQFTLFLPPQS